MAPEKPASTVHSVMDEAEKRLSLLEDYLEEVGRLTLTVNIEF